MPNGFIWPFDGQNSNLIQLYWVREMADITFTFSLLFGTASQSIDLNHLCFFTSSAPFWKTRGAGKRSPLLTSEEQRMKPVTRHTWLKLNCEVWNQRRNTLRASFLSARERSQTKSDSDREHMGFRKIRDCRVNWWTMSVNFSNVLFHLRGVTQGQVVEKDMQAGCPRRISETCASLSPQALPRRCLCFALLKRK